MSWSFSRLDYTIIKFSVSTVGVLHSYMLRSFGGLVRNVSGNWFSV